MRALSFIAGHSPLMGFRMAALGADADAGRTGRKTAATPSAASLTRTAARASSAPASLAGASSAGTCAVSSWHGVILLSLPDARRSGRPV